MKIKRKVSDIGGDPEIYYKIVTFGNRSIEWECIGYSRTGSKVRFSRIIPLSAKDWSLKVITIYKNPDDDCFTND